METKTESRSKPALSSTKSIDEGFESDPDRDLATDTDQNSTVSRAQSFDVLQRTDRDGVQHTQITRRQNIAGPSTNNSNHQKDIESDLRSNGFAVTKSKVSIPRAGQRNQSTLQQGQQQQQQLPQQQQHQKPQLHLQYNNMNYRRSTTTKPATTSAGDPNNLRSLSTETFRARSASGYHRDNNSNIMVGKYVRVSVQPPATSLSSSSSTRYYVNSNQVAQSQQYHQMNGNSTIMQNPNSLYTFYPAEGNISLYPSQYGLKYKSSHLSVQEHAPVTMWTQSVPRQARR